MYKAKRKLKPTKIILCQDGVSEGQFDQVLVHEVRVVQQACIMLESLEPSEDDYRLFNAKLNEIYFVSSGRHTCATQKDTNMASLYKSL